MDYHERLITILQADKNFSRYLTAVKSFNLSSWCIGAGVIRNIVWANLHGILSPKHQDIDVAFFDPDRSTEQEKEIENSLSAMCTDVKWDVKNQALVHLWYEQKFGFAVDPLSSLKDAISTWPETATCVGAYLDENNEIQIIAPYGLEDLFEIVLRINPKRVTKEIFQRRLIQKT